MQQEKVNNLCVYSRFTQILFKSHEYFWVGSPVPRSIKRARYVWKISLSGPKETESAVGEDEENKF